MSSGGIGPNLILTLCPKKIFVTLLLMLETAPLHDCSSLLLLETAISSELFLVSAGLHEAETLVLKMELFSTWLV